MIGAKRRVTLLALGLLFASGASGVDTTVLPNAELQRRYAALTHELRCMKCQNNSIADSPAGLASDLRRDVQEQLLAGKSDDEIRESMTRRYGNVILFRPPMQAGTAWVWIAPIVMLLGGVIVGVVIVRRRSALVASDDSVVETEDTPR